MNGGEAPVRLALELGARRAALIAGDQLPLDRAFRSYCEQNACGNYAKSWMCPPDVGEIDALMARARSFSRVLVYQTVGELEDSYDFEGMMAAGARHNALAQALGERLGRMGFSDSLHLGAGGCRLCPVCAKKTNQPCRHPERALASLEAYGVNVSLLAETCGMPYIHGPNTVTYFGAFLFNPQDI